MCISIWVRKEMKRKEVKKVEPKGFKFVKKDEEPDYSVRGGCICW